ncbi:hypothetical protein LXL04_038877 [Taraxacum kok-saghyz]
MTIPPLPVFFPMRYQSPRCSPSILDELLNHLPHVLLSSRNCLASDGSSQRMVSRSVGDRRGGGGGGLRGYLDRLIFSVLFRMLRVGRDPSKDIGSTILVNLMKQKKTPWLFFLLGMNTSTTFPRGLNNLHNSPFLIPIGTLET